jgi:hypothetical protein
MDTDELIAMRQIRRWILGLMIGLAIIGGIATIISRAFDLAWFPWQVKMQTGMIRASNSYVTTQQAALRQFRMAYDDTEDQGQKAGAVRQMRQIADTIPSDVQPDIAQFLATH